MNSLPYRESTACRLALSLVQMHAGGRRLTLFAGNRTALLLLAPHSLTGDRGFLGL